MFVTKKSLPRRTILRGLGATLALPLLDAMVPALSALAATEAKPARRLGFALENFDAVGKWRTTLDGTTKIDASGALPDGTTFDGPAALREALLRHRADFVRTLTEKLLTYALGRGVESHDYPAVRQILRATASNDYRWSGLILQIVKSVPFQMRRAGERPPVGTTASVH